MNAKDREVFKDSFANLISQAVVSGLSVDDLLEILARSVNIIYQSSNYTTIKYAYFLDRFSDFLRKTKYTKEEWAKFFR